MPRRRGATNLDRVRPCRLGVLDHDDGIGAARQRTAGGDRRCGSGRHLQRWRGAAVNGFAVQPKTNRLALSRRDDIRRAHGEAVDIGAVERGNIDRSRDVLGECRTECIGELADIGRNRAREQ